MRPCGTLYLYLWLHSFSTDPRLKRVFTMRLNIKRVPFCVYNFVLPLHMTFKHIYHSHTYPLLRIVFVENVVVLPTAPWLWLKLFSFLISECVRRANWNAAVSLSSTSLQYKWFRVNGMKCSDTFCCAFQFFEWLRAAQWMAGDTRFPNHCNPFKGISLVLAWPPRFSSMRNVHKCPNENDNYAAIQLEYMQMARVR